MTYSEETAVRLLRSLVNDGDSLYCKPAQRDMLRSVLRVVDDLKRENTTLRQKNGQEKQHART